MSSTVIHGGGIDRVIEVDGNGNLTLNDLRITGGSVNNDGGGLLIEEAGGTATLNRVEILGNQITAGRVGAGIHNAGGTLIVNSSRIYGNSATGSAGGGISNFGTATITASSIFNNTSDYGGGISQSSGTLTTVNTTISGNTVNVAGGGIEVSGGSATIRFSTIANNSNFGGNGGGLNVVGGTATIEASIIGDNSSSSGGRDVHGAVTSSGHNIIEHNTGFSGTVATDILGNDAGLSALTTDSLTGLAVHSIQATSIARNAASGSSPTTDQRGKTRTGVFDIGAFEYVDYTVINTNNSGSGSLRQAIIDANAYAGVDTINFNIAGGGTKIISLLQRSIRSPNGSPSTEPRSRDGSRAVSFPSLSMATILAVMDWTSATTRTTASFGALSFATSA